MNETKKGVRIPHPTKDGLLRYFIECLVFGAVTLIAAYIVVHSPTAIVAQFTANLIVIVSGIFGLFIILTVLCIVLIVGVAAIKRVDMRNKEVIK